MIYISTGGFSKNSFLQTSRLLKNKVIKGLELSSGKYTSTLNSDLKQVSNDFHISLHNYFPVPKKPFVFNLASCNKNISKKSIEHAKNAIELTAKYGAKYYSFHAGYLLDPEPSELGKKINSKTLNPRDVGLGQFVDSVNEIASFARNCDVELLIENNVITKENIESFGCNPLLMTDLEETNRVFDLVDDSVNLLIDVAHLKVSSKTQDFDPVDYLKSLNHIVKAYHISDNDGLVDSNQPFSKESWFVPYLRKDLDYYSLEVYTSDVALLESQYILLSDILSDK